MFLKLLIAKQELSEFVKVLNLREIFGTGETAPWNSAKSCKKTCVPPLRYGGRRRDENGGFGTDFSRRCGLAGLVRPKNDKKWKSVEKYS